MPTKSAPEFEQSPCKELHRLLESASHGERHSGFHSEFFRAALEDFNLAQLTLDEPQKPMVVIQVGRDTEWNVLEELKRFCEKAGIDLKRLIMDLDFGLLD